MAGISTKALAKYLNLSVKQVRTLEAAKVFTSLGRNQWDPTNCVHAYIKHLQAGAISGDSSLSQEQVAALLGVTTRRVRQREIERYPPPKDSSGRYPCREFGAWLLEDFRRGIGVGDDGNVYDYEGERARLTHHQANVAALDEQVKSGKLIPAELVLTAWSGRVASARAKLLALPSRMASSCSGKPAGEVESESRAIIYEALQELASGSGDDEV
jgi:phage terminase Nu1 subunit (DNA packaging protein)